MLFEMLNFSTRKQKFTTLKVHRLQINSISIYTHTLSDEVENAKLKTIIGFRTSQLGSYKEQANSQSCNV